MSRSGGGSEAARPQGELAADLGVRLVAADLAAFDTLSVDTLVVFCWSDVRPLRGMAGFLDWRMCGGVSALIAGGDFLAEPGEVVLMPTRPRVGKRRVFLFGLGPYAAYGQELAGVCRMAVDVLRRAGTQRAVFLAPRADRAADEETRFCAALAAALGSQRELADCVFVEKPA